MNFEYIIFTEYAKVHPDLTLPKCVFGQTGEEILHFLDV